MGKSPIFVSFYCGDEYYYRAAEQLKRDCERCGVLFDIAELHVPPHLNWAQICKNKIEFYRQKLDEHRRPIVWLDADSRMLRRPDELMGCTFDLVGFAGRLRYIRDYNPFETVRFWIPGMLYLGHTERTLRFVEHMQRVLAGSPDNVTDDYVLHETWTNFPEQLSVGFLPPSYVARQPDHPVTERTVFVIGASGKAAEWRRRTVQHAKPVQDPRLVAQTLVDCGEAALREGDKQAASVFLGRAVRLRPDDVETAVRYAESLRAQRQVDDALTFLRDHSARFPQELRLRQKLIQTALLHRRFDVAHEQIQGLANSDHADWRSYARSLAFDLDLEKRALELDGRADRMALWWMKTPYPGNFGDVLNPYLIEKLTGVPPRFAPRGRGMLAVGSVIKFAKAGTLVWGTGTPRMTDKLSTEAQYLAVRGPLTRDLVLRSGGQCPEVYGDPALLLPRLYQPTPAEPKAKLGLVLHTAHQGRVQVEPGVREISVLRVGYREIEAFIDEVVSCEAILSSSLHGLIVAHAYGVPARWCTVSGGKEISGDGTKFLDYFLSVNMPEQEPLDLVDHRGITTRLLSEIPELKMSYSPAPLLEAFPARTAVTQDPGRRSV